MVLLRGLYLLSCSWGFFFGDHPESCRDYTLQSAPKGQIQHSTSSKNIHLLLLTVGFEGRQQRLMA